MCRKLRLKPGERFLDIGCGWGAMVCWAAQHYGVTAHGITHDEEGWHPTLDAEFINRYVFPGGELDTISNILRGMEQAAFEIHDVENLRMHYAMTLREWVKRLEDNHDAALNYVSEDAYRVWRFYMAACAMEFEAEGTSIYQVLASKRGSHSLPVPLTRNDLYEKPLPLV